MTSELLAESDGSRVSSGRIKLMDGGPESNFGAVKRDAFYLRPPPLRCRTMLRSAEACLRSGCRLARNGEDGLVGDEGGRELLRRRLRLVWGQRQASAGGMV